MQMHVMREPTCIFVYSVGAFLDAKLENADRALLFLRVLRLPWQGDHVCAQRLQDFQILQVGINKFSPVVNFNFFT